MNTKENVSSLLIETLCSIFLPFHKYFIERNLIKISTCLWISI